MVNFLKGHLHRLCCRPNTCPDHHSSLLWHQSALNRKKTCHELDQVFSFSLLLHSLCVSPVEMLLAAHVPQDLGAPDTASLTSNYSHIHPAAPISPRPRTASETGPRSVIPSPSRDSCTFAQAETGDKTLTADRRTDEWMDGQTTGGLFKWDSTAGWRRQRDLVKEINRRTLSLLIKTGYWGFTNHSWYFSPSKTIQRFAKHLHDLHTFLLKVTYK